MNAETEQLIFQLEAIDPRSASWRRPTCRVHRLGQLLCSLAAAARDRAAVRLRVEAGRTFP